MRTGMYLYKVMFICGYVNKENRITFNGLILCSVEEFQSYVYESTLNINQ